MSLEFRTPKDAAATTVINRVGRLEPWGASGIPVDDAAQVMHELQDEHGDPLDGKELENAARAWADSRGLVVVDAKTRPPLQRQSARTGEPDGDADPDAENKEEAE